MDKQGLTEDQMSLVMRKCVLRDFRPGPTQTGLYISFEFHIEKEEGLYYLFSENKGADQPYW